MEKAFIGKMEAWIAREKDGRLLLFGVRPTRNKELDYWHYPSSDGEGYMYKALVWSINPELYPDLNWEDLPLKVELTAIIKQ